MLAQVITVVTLMVVSSSVFIKFVTLPLAYIMGGGDSLSSLWELQALGLSVALTIPLQFFIIYVVGFLLWLFVPGVDELMDAVGINDGTEW